MGDKIDINICKSNEKIAKKKKFRDINTKEVISNSRNKKRKSKLKKKKGPGRKDDERPVKASDDDKSDIEICEFSDGEEMDDSELRNDVDQFLQSLQFERFSSTFVGSNDENDSNDVPQSSKSKKRKHDKIQNEPKSPVGRKKKNIDGKISEDSKALSQNEVQENCKNISENYSEQDSNKSKKSKKKKKKIKNISDEHKEGDSELANASKLESNNKKQQQNNAIKKSLLKTAKNLNLSDECTSINRQECVSNQVNKKDKNRIQDSDSEKLGSCNKDIVQGKKNEIMEKLKKQLQSASFRLINEHLYTSSGTDAYQMFKDDPNSFKVYHEGYSKQVSEWPVNPLNLIISWLRKKPRNWTIADFGCGSAELAKNVKQKVYSIDLIASAPNVIECNMAHTPLESDSVNVAVFCLSLMGTNLTEFIVEANRVLVDRGVLKIAEIESRFEDNVSPFLKVMLMLGFKLIHKNQNQNYFWLFDFIKVKSVKLKSKLPELRLKPCMYKKR